MTWTAPDVVRQPGPWTGGERALLEWFLDFHRLTLLHKCAGLTAEQLAARPAEPSALSLAGLVRHMTDVERGWFRRGFGGQPAEPAYCTSERPDADFEDADASRARLDLATYQREIDLARSAVHGRALDEAVHGQTRDTDISLRWIFLHMIGEYARHNGHADLIRERLDGATGQ